MVLEGFGIRFAQGSPAGFRTTRGTAGLGTPGPRRRIRRTWGGWSHVINSWLKFAEGIHPQRVGGHESPPECPPKGPRLRITAGVSSIVPSNAS